MLKNILICSFLAIMVCGFAEDYLSERFYGTYLPVEYIRLLKQTKSHSMAALNVSRRRIYNILGVTPGVIYSDDNFHDHFAVKMEELMHNFANHDSDYLTDKKGHIYRKISNETNFGLQLWYYYNEILLNHDYLDDHGDNHSVTFRAGENGALEIGGIPFYLYTTVMGREDKFDLFFNRETDQMYGVEIRDHYVALYEVEDMGEITFDINEKTVKEKYRFHVNYATAEPGIKQKIDLYRFVELLESENDAGALAALLKYSESHDPADDPAAPVDDHDILRNVFYALGNFYFDNEPDNAEEYYLRALKFCWSNKTRESRAGCDGQWYDEGWNNAPCYYIAYNLACLHARKLDRSLSVEHKTAALTWLETALCMGYPHLEYLYRDADTQTLRREYAAEFERVLADADNRQP